MFVNSLIWEIVLFYQVIIKLYSNCVRLYVQSTVRQVRINKYDGPVPYPLCAVIVLTRMLTFLYVRNKEINLARYEGCYNFSQIEFYA